MHDQCWVSKNIHVWDLDDDVVLEFASHNSNSSCLKIHNPLYNRYNNDMNEIKKEHKHKREGVGMTMKINYETRVEEIINRRSTGWWYYVHINAHYMKRFYSNPLRTKKKRLKVTKRCIYERGEEIIKCGLRKREIKKTFSTWWVVQ